jgi:hypothetical protein
MNSSSSQGSVEPAKPSAEELAKSAHYDLIGRLFRRSAGLFLIAIFVPILIVIASSKLGNQVLLNHFIPLVGVPVSAAVALAIVGMARAVASPSRQVGITSTTVSWILCFLTIVLAMGMTWTLSVPKVISPTPTSHAEAGP